MDRPADPRWIVHDLRATLTGMAQIDPEDDDLHRYLVRRYRYDPERGERRHVVVAAFDDVQEQLRLIDELHAHLKARRETGEPVDPQEHVSGTELEPGYRRLHADARLLRELLVRGGPVSDWAETMDLPRGVSRLVIRDPD